MEQAEPQAANLTPNQIVAFNLRKARLERGWTQEEAADALAPFLGAKWTSSAFSVAERWNPKPGLKVRRYDPDTLAAMAMCFGHPVSWFFNPPDPADLALPGVELPGQRVEVARYTRIAVGLDTALGELTETMRSELDQLENRMRDVTARYSAFTEQVRQGDAETKQRQAQLADVLLGLGFTHDEASEVAAQIVRENADLGGPTVREVLEARRKREAAATANKGGQ